MRGQVFRRVHSLEPYKGDLQGQQGAQQVKQVIGHIEATGHSLGEQGKQGENGDDIGDEGIATPGRHHVEVGQGTQSTPEKTAGDDSLEEEVEGEDQSKYTNTFIIIATSHTPAHITRHNTHEQGSIETTLFTTTHHFSQLISRQGSQGSKYRGQEYTDIPDFNWQRQTMQYMVDETTSGHDARIYSTTY